MRILIIHIPKPSLVIMFACMMLQWAPVNAQAAVLNVKDFGAVGDGRHDDEAAIQRAVNAALHSGPGTSVLLPTGTYLLADRTRRGPAQINIRDLRDFTLMGQKGSVLLTDAPTVTVIGIFASSNITVRQLIIRRTHNVFSRVKVVGLDAAAHNVIVKIIPNSLALDDDLIRDQKFLIVEGEGGPNSWGDHQADCGWFNERDNSVCWPPSIVERARLPNQEWLLHLNAVPTRYDLGKTAFVWGGTYKSHAFSIAKTNRALVEDVTYYPGGTDGGFVLADDTGNITFKRFILDTPPGSGDIIAAIGGSMAINNHIALTLDSVTIAHVWDDAVNIGTDGVRIYAHPSPRVIYVDALHAKDFRLGDTVAIWNWKTRRERDRAKIVKIALVGSSLVTWAVLLDHSVSTERVGYEPGSAPGLNNNANDLVFDLNSTGLIHVVKSTFQSLHARDIVLRASHSVIERSTFQDTVMAGIMIAPEAVWDEGPGVEDVVIKNNIFSNVSGSNVLSSYGAEDDEVYSSKIYITGNRFLSYGRYQHGLQGDRELPVFLSNVSTGTVSNNCFVPFVPFPRPPIFVSSTSNISVKKNSFRSGK